MSKKSSDIISGSDIENAIAAAGSRFTVDQIIGSLAAGKEPEGLRRRVERFIASDAGLFYDEQWQCRTREDFFTGRKFLITPDEWEINTGILFPGHRFVPFVPESIFPSTVTMKTGGSTVPMKKQISPLGNCFHYHILLGSEQIFDFMIADDPANESLKQQATRTDPVTLVVFDLKNFYQQHEFLFGDALLCTVEDYRQGIISMEYLSGSDRGSQARKEFIREMDDAAVRVWEEFQDYPDIPEQLAWMVYYADGKCSCGASIDEFIAGSDKIQLRPEGDHAVLTVSSAEDGDHCHHDGCQCGEDDTVELPDGLSISSGDLDDPYKLLANAGIALNAAEVDGFILDAIYGRETEFAGVQSRIFGNSTVDLPDEAQQAVLLNFLEERFEIMLENYNRTDDEPKAELRSQIMEAVSRRIDYLAMLGTSDCDPGEKEREKIQLLAGVAAKLGEALKLLNNPGFTPDLKEKENLEILIDDQLAIQEDILSDYSTDANQ